MSSQLKVWRDSATLILAACGHKVKNAIPTSTCNYNLLCLKRHENSSFMPNRYVFPGGVIDPADADLKWHELFDKFGYNQSSFATLFPQASSRPDIFKQRPNELPREISLRITAIRETFEESGILICKRGNSKKSFSHWSQHLEFPKEDKEHWQKKVHNDATEFYTLCEKLQCFPDLWSMYEWSNWMTPTDIPGKRFDTAFFLACLPSIPNAIHDSVEMQDIQWSTPEKLLSKEYVSMLAPPQQYEVARIGKFKTIDDLLNDAVNTNKVGVQLMLPVRLRLSDGSLYVLPGDSMYPEDVHRSESQIIDRSDMTLSECRQTSSKTNRYEFLKPEGRIFIQNVESM